MTSTANEIIPSTQIPKTRSVYPRTDPKRHGVRSETVIAIDFTKKIVLIGGSSYAGEIKKVVFTTMNYFLPAQAVMPMHCSAHVGPKGDAAIFFGLSGT